MVDYSGKQIKTDQKFVDVITLFYDYNRLISILIEQTSLTRFFNRRKNGCVGEANNIRDLTTILFILYPGL